ncbi:hypothetical protein [endosymbiont GvMRE of Glomus versiforme]|uniref:hypothetical protein n=1 Tax=endosymbiont GvMRE of Glomus versiforme TaxID=2039283 RepID=UPI0011C3DA52|nr:hypothetical protein [endosymbiont GvMRE of Glomus versiforme]
MWNYEKDQEFKQWLRKNYTCLQCKKELFIFSENKITTNFFTRVHLTIKIDEPWKIFSEPKDKGKYCEKCKKKLEKAEKNWIYNLTNLTEPVEEVFSIFHKEKMRKTPIPVADQEKVIEFYKQKYCSLDLKCSVCGDYSVWIGEDESGAKCVFYEDYSAVENEDSSGGIYCAEHIKGKHKTGKMWASNYLYDLWEEWKKEVNNSSQSVVPEATEKPTSFWFANWWWIITYCRFYLLFDR